MQITPEKHDFIEKWSRYFEDAGGSKTLGRVFGYLLLADEPKNLDQIASDLLFSKATASLTIRQGLSIRLFEKLGRPGERRDYYRDNIQSWINSSLAKLQVLDEWKLLLEQGLNLVPEEGRNARQNLLEMKDYLDFMCWYLSDIREFYQRWKNSELG